MMNLKTNSTNILYSLSNYQAHLLFLNNNLLLMPTHFNNGTFGLFQNEKVIGEIINESGTWMPNNQILFKHPFNNKYSASLAELISRPIAGIPSEKYAKKRLALLD